jgi:molybdate/tungstate transport system substrate-binding protein
MSPAFLSYVCSCRVELKAGRRKAATASILVLILMAPAAKAAAIGSLTPLEVAYAGSMGSMMDSGIRPAAAKALGADLRGRAQGSTGLANLIVAGSIRPDVFIAVTPEPMRIVLRAGKAEKAVAIARTEMVIAYSRDSRYAGELAKSAGPGNKPWWRVLETRGLRFGRTDPNVDPQGLNLIFMMQLAEGYYHQPGLETKILGPVINPRQIFQEPQLMARLQAGQLDAASAYKTQPAALGLPFVTLPDEINLGSVSMQQQYQRASVTLNGRTHRPSPLVFYAAVLKEAHEPAMAKRFVAWMQGAQARAILAEFKYDAPGDAAALLP